MNPKMNYLNDLQAALMKSFDEEAVDKIITLATIKLLGYEVTEQCTALAVVETESEKMLRRFLATKKVEGCSDRTIERYEYIIRRLIDYLNMPVKEMDVYALRLYLAELEMNGNALSTIRGIKDIFSSFFGWLHREGYIQSNPTSNLNQVKCRQIIRSKFSDIDIERMRRGCKSKRDRAVVEFLLSTGCRISELCGVNIEDVDFKNQECTVLGKGNKERVVYLNSLCSTYLAEYLNSRDDSKEALFTGKGTERMTPGGIRFTLKQLEQETGVKHIHPHKFRRTLATNLIEDGMPIQEVAMILGHTNINTTMIYVCVDKNRVKSSFFSRRSS